MVLVNVAKIVFIVDILVPLSPGSGKDSHIPTSSPTHDIIKVLHLGAIWGKENTASISQMNKEPQATEALCLRKGSKGFPGGASGKEPACQCRRHKKQSFNPWVGKIPWRRAWQPTPVFLPGESHGQRSLAGCSPWGHKESDTTEAP